MKLILGDSLQKLKDLPSNTIDAVVTDSPYGIAFMQRKWDYDVPSIDLWAEVHRVLKPGGHVLSFFGTRTYHAGVIRMEAAGFEIRDMLQWLYGSGFPKSLDVSKAIDKAAGAEREKIMVPTKPGNHPDQAGDIALGATGMRDISLPATADARKWQGFGTALKPANEPIVLARKPLEKGLTVAQNVLKWGTGALNIDASRIAGGKRHPGNYVADSTNSYSNFGHHDRSQFDSTKGRWPSNLLLDEAAAEMLDAQSGVSKSVASVRKNKASDSIGTFKTNDRETNGHSDSGGASRFFQVIKQTKFDIETACTLLEQSSSNGAKTDELDKCPSTDGFGKITTAQYLLTTISITKTEIGSTITFQILNASTKMPIATCIIASEKTIEEFSAGSVESVEFAGDTEVLITLADGQQVPIKGTVSIVQGPNYKSGESKTESITTAITGNIVSADRFFYVAKASKRERNAGLEGMPKKFTATMNDGIGAREHNESEPTAHNANHHPTVKPIKLMEYLCTLVAPPGAIILDPFMGSGTTGCAAVKLGYQFIGIERELEYLEISKRRISFWANEASGREPSEDSQLRSPLEPA